VEGGSGAWARNAGSDQSADGRSDHRAGVMGCNVSQINAVLC
jgi:hypothetical protein